MKRLISLAVAAVLCLCALASCKDGGGDVHEHSYEKSWSSNSDGHWHACSSESCAVKADFTAHTYKENNKDPENPKNECTVCGYVEQVPEHEHTFRVSGGFISNSGFHWRRCLRDGCTEKKDREEHRYGNPVVVQTAKNIYKTYECVDCAHRKTQTLDIISEVDDAEMWDAAFKALDFSNYSATALIEDAEGKKKNTVQFSEYGTYFCDVGVLEYYTVIEDGKYITYKKNPAVGGNGYERIESDSDEYYTGAKNQTVINISFESYFSLFKYDETSGKYTCDETIETVIYNFDGIPVDTIYCYNISVFMTQGKLISISMNYYMDESELGTCTRTLEYYNIGMTEVTVPRDVME